MKERPIIFSAEMVQAILDGRKTMTRRVVKPQPEGELRPLTEWSAGIAHACGVSPSHRDITEHSERMRGRVFPFKRDGAANLSSPNCPYGVPGQGLWVRETWADTNGEFGPMISYRAGGDRFLVEESSPLDYGIYPNCSFTMWCGDLRRGEPGHAWRSPIHMPRWASRISLEITDVKIERLKDITEEDCLREGAPSRAIDYFTWFQKLWDSINQDKTSWIHNPWVWVITFRVASQATADRLPQDQGSAHQSA